ncbi:MAG TPA: CocE/NonD family hydrolase [Acidimicrobiales bacterium]|nr:CocE/NonD family hydrolase [Acidimicrobiales bacterium]
MILGVARGLLCFALASVLGIAAFAPAAGASDPNAYTLTQTYIASSNGVKLHTAVFRPAGAGPTAKTPVILTVSPYFTSGMTPLGPYDPSGNPTPTPGSFAERASVFAHGYSVVQVALRGYGASTGCYDEGGPGERQDVKRAVEWAASQPWSTGRVGMVGHSYDAQTQLMALGMHPKGLAAVVPSAAPAGYANFFSAGVSTVTGRAFGAFYGVSDLLPPSTKAPASQQVNAAHGPLSYPTCYATTPVGTYSDRADSRYWRDRDLGALAAGTTIPVMAEQGFDDFNVRSSNFTAFWSGLKGPKRAFLGPWDHGLSHDGPGNTFETLRWLDAWVKNDPAAQAYERAAPPITVQDIDGRYRAEETWPPADAVGKAFRIRSGDYLDSAVNFSENGLPPAVTGAAGLKKAPTPLPTGVGTWTFSQPLAQSLRISGQPSARVHVRSVAPRTTLIALLYDVAPNGNAKFVGRGGRLLRARGEQTVTVTLYPNDWEFAPGHRVGLLLTGSDGVWLETGNTGTVVHVIGGSLVLPALTQPRTAFLPGGPYPVLPQIPPFRISPQTIRQRS